MSDEKFLTEPSTQREVILDMWKDLKEVRAQTTETNGRVTRLERATLLTGGIMVGVLAKEVLPILLPLLARAGQ